MRIAGLQKMTLLDYPEHVAATVFVDGCNFRCPFCYNSGLLAKTPDHLLLSESDFFTFLYQRASLLDGVCITGGEPTLQPDLAPFCMEIHKRGLLVKLDTNGASPEVLQELIDAHAIDYVAIDLKNTPQKYALSCGVSTNPYSRVCTCMDTLHDHALPFELRTTVTKELHTEQDLMELAGFISTQGAWFIQNFEDGPSVLAGEGALHPWSVEELEALLPRLKDLCPGAQIRGTR